MPPGSQCSLTATVKRIPLFALMRSVEQGPDIARLTSPILSLERQPAPTRLTLHFSIENSSIQTFLLFFSQFYRASNLIELFHNFFTYKYSGITFFSPTPLIPGHYVHTPQVLHLLNIQLTWFLCPHFSGTNPIHHRRKLRLFPTSKLATFYITCFLNFCKKFFLCPHISLHIILQTLIKIVTKLYAYHLFYSPFGLSRFFLIAAFYQLPSFT